MGVWDGGGGWVRSVGSSGCGGVQRQCQRRALLAGAHASGHAVPPCPHTSFPSSASHRPHCCPPPPPNPPPPTHNPHPPARATDTITTERALALLRASKRGKLPVVNAAGELVALATRALFKAHSGMPLGGGWAGGRRRIAAAAGCTGPGFCSGGLDDPGCGVVPAAAITATYLPAHLSVHLHPPPPDTASRPALGGPRRPPAGGRGRGHPGV